MNNLPENENVLKNENEEFSTVFSDPTEHKKTSDKKKKPKRFITVISAFLAVAVLVGSTVGIIKLIPKKETDQQQETIFDEIEVLSLDVNTLTSVEITNSNSSFKLYSEKETDENTSSQSTVLNWYVDGIEKDLINTDTAANVVVSLSNISAQKEITKKTAEECGLENPYATAILTDESGKTTKILLGDLSPDNSGSYLKIDGSEKIYLVDSSAVYSLEMTVLDLGDTSYMDSFPLNDNMTDYKDSEGLLAKFEKLTLSGKNFTTPIVIEENTNEKFNAYLGYVVTSPNYHTAENIDSVFNIFKSGVAVAGTYSFDKSASSLKKFGLDNPDFEATMEISGLTHTFKFKLQEDGFYAAVCDSVKLIQKVSGDSISFINQTANDFYSSFICLHSIEDLQSLVIKTPEKEYTFEITDVEDEEAETSFSVKYDGKDFDTESLQDLYMLVVSLPCNDFTTENVALNPEYSFTFNFKSDIGGKNVIDFVKVSETRYQYFSDGKASGKVTSSELKKVINKLESITK